MKEFPKNQPQAEQTDAAREGLSEAQKADLFRAYSQHYVTIVRFKDGRAPLRGRLWKLDMNEGTATINFTGRDGGGDISLKDVAEVEIEK